MFVTSVCTGCSTISRTPTAAARWYTTSQRCTSSLTTDDFRTESTTRWKSRRSRRWATFRSEPVERSSRTKTSHPCSSRSSARCEPMKPAPPVISALRDTGGRRTAAASVAALVRTPQIVDAAAAQLGLKRSRDSLLNALDAHVVDRSDVVAVTADDASADGSAQLANTFANVLIAQ